MLLLLVLACPPPVPDEDTSAGHVDPAPGPPPPSTPRAKAARGDRRALAQDLAMRRKFDAMVEEIAGPDDAFPTGRRPVDPAPSVPEGVDETTRMSISRPDGTPLVEAWTDPADPSRLVIQTSGALDDPPGAAPQRLALASARTTAPGDLPGPRVPAGAVVRPTYHLDSGSLAMGTAFFVDVFGRPLLVAPQHIFGPSGGLARAWTADEVATRVRSATTPAGPSVASVRVPVADGSDPGRDIAAWQAPAGAPTLAMAHGLPAAGSVAWIALPDASVQVAVVAPQAGRILVALRRAGAGDRSAHGAPLVDAEGKVLGMLVGQFEQLGAVYGVVAPIDALAQALTADADGSSR